VSRKPVKHIKVAIRYNWSGRKSCLAYPSGVDDYVWLDPIAYRKTITHSQADAMVRVQPFFGTRPPHGNAVVGHRRPQRGAGRWRLRHAMTSMFGPNVPQHPRRCQANILETSGLQKHRQALGHLDRALVGKSLRSNESCSKLRPCLILQRA
jgi:hypothetical protein